MATIRTRKWYAAPVSGTNRVTPAQPWTSYSSPGFESFETVISESNFRLPGGRWSGGAAFSVNRDRKTWSPSPLHAERFYSNGALIGTGTVRIEGDTAGITKLPLPSPPSNSELDALGTTAVARTEPTNPAFDLATFLGELRAEGLPNTPGLSVMERTRAAKAAGGEYLNVEFGWLPLVRGVRDFATTVQHADEIITRHQQNANRVIQRKYEWPEVVTSRADATSFSMTPAWGFFTGGGLHQRSWSRQWFEAEYMFYLPTGNSLNAKIKRYGSYARKLLGVDLTPEVLWNLSPWSWAADWFANTGDVMHNISALGPDGVVMQHGYVMSHTGLETVSTGAYRGAWQSSVRTVEAKLRRTAFPYGFGLSYDGLSPKQKAILFALGLSKGR
nr:MAG: hypothetical protein 1 [Leviviridae sp.]